MSSLIHPLSRAVIIVDKHILLCKTKGLKPDFYFLPGGHVEHLESLEQTLKRELLEEIGYEFKIEKFLFFPKIALSAVLPPAYFYKRTIPLQRIFYK